MMSLLHTRFHKMSINHEPIVKVRNCLAAITEANLEESLSAFRSSRAIEAVVSLQRKSVEKGTDKISLNEINAEIKSVREKRV